MSEKGKTPHIFSDVVLAKEMGLSYWELMGEPTFFIELYKIFLEGQAVAGKIRQEKEKRNIH